MTSDALDPNIAALQQLLASRSALGLEKHGVTTAAAGLSHTERLQHTMLELLDGAVYLMSALRGRDDAAPISMVLFCPFCGTLHVDAADPANGWTNPPHRSHLCHSCGKTWRPADVPTSGVASLVTKGQLDAALPTTAQPAAAAKRLFRVERDRKTKPAAATALDRRRR